MKNEAIGKVVCVVQARMGSERLKNKMMLWLHGTPVAGWIYERLQRCCLVDDIVFALPETTDNNSLDCYLQGIGATTYRGPESNVLQRVYEAARILDADHVVRVCGDNPFITWSEVDRLIDYYISRGCEYAYNHIPRENLYPDGLGAEIASLQVIDNLMKRVTLDEDKEHMFNYLWRNIATFSIGTFDPVEEELKRPDLQLDLDTGADYQWMLGLDVKIDSDAVEIVRCASEPRLRR